MRIRFCVSLSFLILLAFYGCGGSAEVERKQAQYAMDQAKSLHAADYAASNFEQAQTAWDRAQAAEKEGKTDKAKVLFTSAKIYFGKAGDVAKAKRDALSRELDSMQLMIGSNLDQVKTDLTTKHLSAKQRSQVEAIVSGAEKANESISKLVSQDDLRKAVATAKDVQTKIYHAQLILAGQKIK